MESAAQSRLVAVSSSRLTEALARWWSLEKSFLDTVGRLAAEPPLGSILERERTQLDGLRAVMRAGLPHRRVDGPVTPRGRQTARRQPTLTLLELKRGLLDENQAVAAEVLFAA